MGYPEFDTTPDAIQIIGMDGFWLKLGVLVVLLGSAVDFVQFIWIIRRTYGRIKRKVMARMRRELYAEMEMTNDTGRHGSTLISLRDIPASSKSRSRAGGRVRKKKGNRA